MLGAIFDAVIPSDAKVDEDGVRGRFVSDARAGGGLSMSWVVEIRVEAGNRVGSPGNILKVLKFGGVVEASCVEALEGMKSPEPTHGTRLESLKRPGNVFA